jgi:adenine-specific DNA-methyltransferase
MFAELELNDWLHNFVKNVLEEYDFTVDESSPSYQQIAIDPEMLGRIFENLLASINPETEKLANERKAFGAFYTPREIVEYMVDQSLRTYLETICFRRMNTRLNRRLSLPW